MPTSLITFAQSPGNIHYQRQSQEIAKRQHREIRKHVSDLSPDVCEMRTAEKRVTGA